MSVFYQLLRDSGAAFFKRAGKNIVFSRRNYPQIIYSVMRIKTFILDGNKCRRHILGKSVDARVDFIVVINGVADPEGIKY